MLGRVDRQEGAGFGATIYQARQAKGWSLRAAAKVTGIAYTRLDELEKGQNWHTRKAVRPTMEQVIRLARTYNLSIDEMLAHAGFEPLFTLDQEERELLHGFRQIPRDGRLRALARMNAFVAEELS